MPVDEIINQLEDLQYHCKEMSDSLLDPEDTWNKDVIALDYAIKVIKRVHQECESIRTKCNKS